jgi:hypothetical protein
MAQSGNPMSAFAQVISRVVCIVSSGVRWALVHIVDKPRSTRFARGLKMPVKTRSTDGSLAVYGWRWRTLCEGLASFTIGGRWNTGKRLTTQY